LFYVCPSVCPHVSVRLSLERFPSNFILGTCKEICLRNLNLVKIAQKHVAPYIKTEVRLDCIGDTESVKVGLIDRHCSIRFLKSEMCKEYGNPTLCYFMRMLPTLLLSDLEPYS
jgi:hypothetical protein